MRVEMGSSALAELPEEDFYDPDPDVEFNSALSPPGHSSCDSVGEFVTTPAPTPFHYAALTTATQNRSRLASFARDSHFKVIHQAETGLFCATFYALCSSDGLVTHLFLTRPKAIQQHFTAFRIVILGAEDMFLAPRSARDFAYEIQRLMRSPWSSLQASVLAATEQLLNRRAHWFSAGFSTLALPSSTPNSPSGFIGQPSPPGHHDLLRAAEISRPAVQHVPQDQLVSMADRIAIGNLQQLERARVQQSAATMFIDLCGRFRHILFGRPDQSNLHFLAGGHSDEDMEEHLAVVRMSLDGTRIEMSHPCDPLNHVQLAVVAAMERILNAAM